MLTQFCFDLNLRDYADTLIGDAKKKEGVSQGESQDENTTAVAAFDQIHMS